LERCPNCKGQLTSCACDVGPLGPEFDWFERERASGYEVTHGKPRPERQYALPKPS
jgi:hypothetical protein